AVPTPAFGAELSEYFERAASAEYSGEQVLTCRTPIGLSDSAARVAQKEGVIYVSAGVEGAPTISAGAGFLAAQGPGGAAAKVQIAAATKPPAGYQLSGVEEVNYLNRTADRVSLATGGETRVRLTFDQATGALFRSETLNNDGSVYCTTKLTSFTPGTPTVEAGGEGEVRTLSRVNEFSDTVFPAKLGGFRRLDVYGWNQVGQMAYYSDGFFALALYNVKGRFSVDDISEAREWEGELGTYQRWFRPGTVTLVWDTTVGGMALHGDLPVDLQEIVLESLPEPSRPGFFSRILSLLGR
ncbi:MAG: hypothetical protein ACREA0_20205, partial [bacterium]